MVFHLKSNTMTSDDFVFINFWLTKLEII
jgi:hypothetical protein